MNTSVVNWSYLIHLGFKMWPYWSKRWNEDVYWDKDPRMKNPDVLLCEKQTWDELVIRLRDAGCNMLIIDIGEGMRFDSHPELALKDSWSKDLMKKELDKLRNMGITPVPKLNFSAGHDEWLGVYERMVSTSVYYEVVSDIIREVAELFGGAGYFHIGMDEEKSMPLSVSEYIVIRRFDLWWHDFNFICENVRKAGCIPMMWPDLLWDSREEFIQNAPRDVVMCNWYYEKFDDLSKTEISAYTWLQKSGFVQMPTASILGYCDQMKDTVKHCRNIIEPDKLFGFMQTVWLPTCHYAMDYHTRAIGALATARMEWETV